MPRTIVSSHRSQLPSRKAVYIIPLSCITPNDDPKIIELLQQLWATGDTQKVADGVLAAEFIWQEDLNKVEGLNLMVKLFLDLIQEKGMLEAVKTIL